MIDRGHILQRGSAAELAARPASAFVADLAGATVLHGEATAGPDGLTAIDLEGGGRIFTGDEATGAVAASVFPSEIALHVGDPGAGSPRNRLRGRVVTVTPLGNRTRVELAVPQPLTAELTGAAAAQLAIEPGAELVAVWKAVATRALPR